MGVRRKIDAAAFKEPACYIWAQQNPALFSRFACARPAVHA